MNRQTDNESIKEKVREVLVFFDMFDYPLKIEEIYEFLGKNDSMERVEEILAEETGIDLKNGLYFLKGRDEVVDISNKRLKILKKYWQKTRRIVPYLKMVPFLKMVAVCNTVAFNSPDEKSDIDLFIVTKPNRIFIARSISTLIMQFFGVRRYADKISERFCLSFYVTEEALDMDKIRIKPDDIYLKYWIATLKPVLDSGVYDRLIDENRWIGSSKGFKKKRLQFIDQKEDVLTAMGLIGERLFGGRVGDFLEKRLEKTHMRRYEKKKRYLGEKSDVIVCRTMLKFHNIDRREEFNRRYKEKRRKLGWN